EKAFEPLANQGQQLAGLFAGVMLMELVSHLCLVTRAGSAVRGSRPGRRQGAQGQAFSERHRCAREKATLSRLRAPCWFAAEPHKYRPGGHRASHRAPRKTRRLSGHIPELSAAGSA